MSFSPIPDICVRTIFSVTPELLRQKRITLLLADLDNTLSPYGEDLPPESVLAWVAGCRAAGIELFMISNTGNEKRAVGYANACEMPYMIRARKPSPKGPLAIMAQLGKRPEETALIGDQIFTDGLAANRAGILSIVTRPLRMGPFLRFRYIVEQPFRYLCKEKKL